MNDETRKALVEELAEAMYECRERMYEPKDRTPWRLLDEFYRKDWREGADTTLMPIIDHLLADRAVPEPDAETVERVGTAILREVDVNNGDPPSELGDQFPENQKLYRKMARAALQAAAMPAPDDNWLDDALDSVGQHGADIGEVTRLDDGTYEALVDVIGIRGGMAFLAAAFHGAGPTRRAAIEDAVRKAKGEGDER